MVEVGSLQPSGRVIASGRLLLGSLFLLAIWSDSSQPARLPAETYALLVIYVAWALTLTLATWRNWWLDARLSVIAHVIDIAVFMAMLFSTEGYTSPYFTFFVFLMLAAAVRWGWRATILTAILMMSLYMLVGMVVSRQNDLALHDFTDRTSHLLILSLILIRFGANQWRSGLVAKTAAYDAEPILDESPQETGHQRIGDADDAAFPGRNGAAGKSGQHQRFVRHQVVVHPARD
jgi:hypothetical protein